MQQIRPFLRIDETKGAVLPQTPRVPATDALPSIGAPATIQLPFPGELAATPDEEQNAGTSKAKKSPDAPAHTSLLSALQAANTTKPARRTIVIHAEKKRKKAASSPDKPARRMSPRLRQGIIVAAIVLFFGITLTTLAPLAAGQSPFNISSGISFLLNSAQKGLQLLAHEDNSHPSTGSTTLPPMTIPKSQLVTIAEQDATAAGINPTYFVRQINLESGFNPNAVSPGGAEGIAQFEPSTAAGLGIDPFNPTQALQAAAQMMARYYHQYGDYAKALAAYNAGPANLQNAENSCGANWLSCMPAETQHYVATIMGT